jgi:CheY-like chemotaxis protein
MKAIDIVKHDSALDLVLIDVHLPFMNGIEATAKIRQIRPNLPVVAQTAFAEPSVIENCLRAGCNGYILKPIDFKEFTKLLELYLVSEPFTNH